MEDKEHLIFDIKPKRGQETPEEVGIKRLYEEELEEEREETKPGKKWGLFGKALKKEEYVPEEPEGELIPKRKGGAKRFLVFVSCVVVLLLVLYVGTSVLPKANVTIHPKRTEKTIKAATTASVDSASIDVENQKIPAKTFVFKRSLSKEYPTSKQTVTQKARGVITIYNAYSSASQRLIATTRFESPDGKIYRIENSVTVPGAKIVNGSIVPSSVDVSVVADQPGVGYNIDPTTFTIPGFKGTPKFAGFYGKSSKPMAGGSQGDLRAVSDTDIQKAKEDLIVSVKELLKTELDEKSKGFVVLDEAISYKISDAQSNRKLGDIADNFQLTGTVELRAIGFAENDIKALAEALVSKEGVEQDLIDFSIEYGTLRINDGFSLAAFSYEIKGVLRDRINEDELKEKILGKKVGEIRSILAKYDTISSAKVSLWPFWVSTVPQNKAKIHLTID